MKLFLIDNYDSFTYNLSHYLEAITHSDVKVVRNDEFNLDEIEGYTHIIISPGPGLPKDAGLSLEVIKRYIGKKSILGVCLGFQAIAEYLGHELYNQEKVQHGISKTIHWNNESELAKDIPKKHAVGLYHSWAVKIEPDSDLLISAKSDDNIIMAIESKELKMAGVQFHPESIMTEHGKEILKNWLNNF